MNEDSTPNLLALLWEGAFFGPFGNLTSLWSFLERSILQERDSLERDAETLAKEWQMPTGEPGLIYPADWLNVVVEYPRLLRNSFVVLAYSVFVAKLNELCELGRHARGASLAYGDISKHRGELSRARIYLEKVIGIKVDRVEWDVADRIKNLRNLLVHDEGRITASDFRSRFGRYVETKPPFLLYESDRINVQVPYCEWVVSQERIWIETLYRGNERTFRPSSFA